MHYRLALVPLGIILPVSLFVGCLSSVQTADSTPSSHINSPLPISDTVSMQHEPDEPATAAPPDILLPNREQPVSVITTLRDENRSSPDHAEKRMRLAQRLYLIGDLDAALDEYRAARALNPTDAIIHAQLGAVLIARQDWKAASVALQEAVQLNPELTEAHYNLGSAQYALGAVQAATRSYRRVIELQPAFPDARYRLALLMKLTHHHQEAANLLEEAALGGVPQAQYFLGNAYQHGQGVDKNLRYAITWWAQSAMLGYQPAAETLSKLRRQVFAFNQPNQRREELVEAFRRYRHHLWDDYPGLTQHGPDQSLGGTLLEEHQSVEGLTMLLAEAYALSEPAQVVLARLYEDGLETSLAPYDHRILACLETTASEGFPPAQKALARIYAKGLGVPVNRDRAIASLKGLPKQDVQVLLDELDLR